MHERDHRFGVAIQQRNFDTPDEVRGFPQAPWPWFCISAPSR